MDTSRTAGHLILSRETVRELTDTTLVRAHGGAMIPTIANLCNFTRLCYSPDCQPPPTDYCR
jgi:hypothetical protein